MVSAMHGDQPIRYYVHIGPIEHNHNIAYIHEIYRGNHKTTDHLHLPFNAVKHTTTEIVMYTDHSPCECLLNKAGTFLQTKQDATWSTHRKIIVYQKTHILLYVVLVEYFCSV